MTAPKHDAQHDPAISRAGATRRATMTLVSLAGGAALLGAGAALLPRRWRDFGAGALSRAAQGATGRSDDDDRLRIPAAGWKTDFTRHTVPLSEIMSGGPGKDGIPPLDQPAFVGVEPAAAWLRDPEPVIAFEHGGVARAYPLQILIWHEIVNDDVAGLPVTITFCPLCNTAIAFDRRLDGVVYDFGTTGNLRYSDLVMWDRQTESWWQQATGEGIVGTLAGRRLTMLPAAIVSWQEFRATWPQGQVLSRQTGFGRDYGTNPYVGYDDVSRPPFLFRGPTDGRLPPMERVLTLEIAGETGSAAVAYPFGKLAERRVVHDTVAGQELVVFWAAGTTSALDRSSIAGSRDIGAAAVFVPVVAPDGEATRPLTFRPDPQAPNRFRDDQTGSQWAITGEAVAGPLRGRRLPPLVHGNHFWFAAAAFRPATEVRLL